MSEPLPGDNPQAYIPGDRRRALARGEELPVKARGAAVFVDISGYTPLTEVLARELGERRGAEELSATVDRVFAALMEPLHARGGSVVYFSGDAITAWIGGDDGSLATACGLAMQEVMARVGTIAVPGGSEVTLGVKVAVAVGEVHRFVVGDARVQLIDVLAGQLMDSLAAAEGTALPGDVVLDAGLSRRSATGFACARPDRERAARSAWSRHWPIRRSLPTPLPTGPTCRWRRPASGCSRPCGSEWWRVAASSSPTCVRRCPSSCASAVSTSRATRTRRGCSTTS